MSNDNALAIREGPEYDPEVTLGQYAPLAVWQSRAAPAVTSLDLDTDAGAQTYLRCLRGSDLKAKQCTAQAIEIRDWFLHQVKPIVNADGEEGSPLRLVWVLADGRTVATRSPALLDGWRHVVQLAKLRGWRFPLSVKLRSVPIGEGREYLEIESVASTSSAVRKSK